MMMSASEDKTATGVNQVPNKLPNNQLNMSSGIFPSQEVLQNFWNQLVPTTNFARSYGQTNDSDDFGYQAPSKDSPTTQENERLKKELEESRRAVEEKDRKIEELKNNIFCFSKHYDATAKLCMELQASAGQNGFEEFLKEMEEVQHLKGKELFDLKKTVNSQKFTIERLEGRLRKREATIGKMKEKIRYLDQDSTTLAPKMNSDDASTSSGKPKEPEVIPREVQKMFTRENLEFCSKYLRRKVQVVSRIPYSKQLFDIFNANLPVGQRKVYGAVERYQCAKLRDILLEEQKKQIDKGWITVRHYNCPSISIGKRKINAEFKMPEDPSPSYQATLDAHELFAKKRRQKNEEMNRQSSSSSLDTTQLSTVPF
ncbi:hypothetical protein GCK72_007007 [Caenorhabditis remanei]|uniref:Uncharacterized protein n=1 Tax=Caenorhabditis remanei TaxID=31234 RepID=A0A6A5HI27_CAERE|nr:hypothetical protein GCK72_007007 [Caenorhabditis remanei]KAF1767049.1 hypothetical protein GCK72_007007 [Caenorhabditis remanei]